MKGPTLHNVSEENEKKTSVIKMLENGGSQSPFGSKVKVDSARAESTTFLGPSGH